uniref:BHLH domain-containing protein n=1 Tax=Panagrellus redivivus TaxID=6233 RepID=A0A7E4UP54_PANRE
MNMAPSDWQIYSPSAVSESSRLKAPKPRRKKCAFKEKMRNDEINKAFQVLQEKTMIGVSPSVKVAKIKTLKVAKMFITYLVDKLNQPDDKFNPSYDDFEALVMQEMISKNTYTTRAAEEMASGPQKATEFPSSPSSTSSSPPGMDAGYVSTGNSTSDSSFSSENDATFCPMSYPPTVTPMPAYSNQYNNYYYDVQSCYSKPIDNSFFITESEYDIPLK